MKNLKVKLSFNHILVTKEMVSSSLVLSMDSRNAAREGVIKDIQTVVKVGPFVKPENGVNLKEGDKVLLDYSKVTAKNAKILNIVFHKETGEYVEDNSKFKPEETEDYLLLTDREILMVIE